MLGFQLQENHMGEVQGDDEDLDPSTLFFIRPELQTDADIQRYVQPDRYPADLFKCSLFKEWASGRKTNLADHR